MADTAVVKLLQSKLPARHVTAAIAHYQSAVVEYQKRVWDNATVKTGKFVEAVLKALAAHAGIAVPAGRAFKVEVYINGLAQATGAADTVRLTIPRACRFIYEVASNRGARHDADEVNPSEMDATVALNLSAWVVSELLRYTQKGGDLDRTASLVSGLMERRYPFIEEVDGRVYFHVRGMSAREAALLTLWYRYPTRVPREELARALRRHRFSVENTNKALARIAATVDDDGSGRLRLLIPGLREAERLIDGARKAE
jgi:hypothetical protein